MSSFYFLCASLLISLTSVAFAGSERAQIVGRDVSLQEEYDFVIIGGGTSGLTVADRLTENQHVSVLVIERGPLDQQEESVLVPGLLNLTSTPYWYNLTSSPQNGLSQRTFQVPAGRVVGGGTVINGILFDRGSAGDYNSWEALGNPGWGWDDLLPYFKKSETFTPASAEYAEEFDIKWDESVHGSDGPVQASYPVFQYPAIVNFFEAWHSLGIETPQDADGGNPTGVYWSPSSLDPKDETRSYARSAHYDRAIASRPNYHLLTDSAVTRILFQDNVAVGVEVINADEIENPHRTVKASKEVILAAGVHSAQILQLSGIGPKSVSQLRIEMVKVLPGVGENFQDHPTFYHAFNFETALHPNADDLTSNATYAAEQLALYHAERKGAHTIVHQGGNTVAFLPLPDLTSDYGTILDAALSNSAQCSDPTSPTCAGKQAQRRLVLNQYKTTTNPVAEFGWNTQSTIPVTLVKPLSRGTVSISSASILDPPAIDFRTFAEVTDLAILVAALEQNREFIQTSAMQVFTPVELSPGLNVTTAEQLIEAVRQSAQPTYSHPCCACPMMPEELGGVVDSELFVHGVERLRIVDASIMPIIPATHLSATVYAVAEKAADLIKSKYAC